MSYLARREHSDGELLRKLRLKKFLDADIKLVLEELSQKGFLSNTRFIENYIHYRREKGFGPLRIEAELLARGLKKEFIEQHLKISDNAWLSVLKRVCKKYLKNTKTKQIRFLLYRGFTTEQIEDIL